MIRVVAAPQITSDLRVPVGLGRFELPRLQPPSLTPSKITAVRVGPSKSEAFDQVRDVGSALREVRPVPARSRISAYILNTSRIVDQVGETAVIHQGHVTRFTIT